MGAYSSWTMFALSHHIIIRYSAYLNWYNELSDYAILGDDVVIADSIVPSTYQEINEDLGVKVYESKTHKDFHLIVFANRIWLNIIQITGF